MFLFISFLLTMVGCVNWLLIGLLQYDFVAGIFGYQGSIFSRIIYIIIGAGAVFFLVKTLMQKGKIELFNFKKKEKHTSPALSRNSEAAFESHHRHKGGYQSDDGRSTSDRRKNTDQSHFDYDDYGENSLDEGRYQKEEFNSLFDEHFDGR